MESTTNSLTEDNKRDIEKLRVLVKEVAQHRHQLTDFYLARWLTARSWNVEAARTMFEVSMEWRKSMDVYNIYKNFPKEHPELFEHYTNYWPGAFLGRTKDGWPLYFERIGYVDPASIIANTTPEFRIKYNIWKMETTEKRRRKIEKERGWSTGTTIVVDMSGIGLSHMSSASLQVFQAVTTINKNNYPETLRKSFIINTPATFSMLWKLISVWMDPSTQDKTTILGSDYLDKLLENMDVEFIPQNLGGKGTHLPEGGVYIPPNLLSQMNHYDVGRGSLFEREIKIQKEGAIIEWEFQSVNYDIGFFVYFKNQQDKNNKEIILENTRYNSNKSSIIAKHVGTYVLVWDNTFSWSRTKSLNYTLNVIQK